VGPVAGREHLARVEAATGAWKLRRWPEEVAGERIAFVHQVLAAAAGGAVPAAATLPEGEGEGTVLTLAGRRYDAQRWLPGRPAVSPAASQFVGATDHLPAVLPEATVAELASLLGRLHRETAVLAIRRAAPAAPLAGLVPAVRRAWAGQRERLRPVAARTPEIQRWLAIGERALPAAEAALSASPVLEQPPIAVLHLGLWPAHVLLADPPTGGVAGLIGWEGAAAGSPLLDLAQLVVRCRGWSAGAAELAIAAYGESRPLPPEERRLLPAVAVLDLVASAGAILDLAFGPDAEGAPPSRLRGAATSFVNSLEVAAGVVAQGERPAKHARRWQHGPRPAPAPTRPAGGARRPARGQGKRAPSRERRPS